MNCFGVPKNEYDCTFIAKKRTSVSVQCYYCNGEFNPDFCLTLAGEGDREFTVQVC